MGLEVRQREADRKQRLNVIDVTINEAMKRPSGTSATGPDKKAGEKIRRFAVTAERALNAMHDAAAALQEANDADDDQK